MSSRFLRFIVAAMLCAPASAAAQEEYDAFLEGDYDGSKIELRLSIGMRRFANLCRCNAVGFDVFRRTLCAECGSEVRITEQPIPWPAVQSPNGQVLTFEDTNVVAGTAYRYEARAIDALRRPAQGTFDAIVGWVPAGTALIAHGSIVSEFANGWWTVGCPAECFTGGLVSVPPELVQYIDMDVTLLLYGNDIDMSGSQANVWIPVLTIQSGQVASCVVGVAPVSWGDVKHRYK